MKQLRVIRIIVAALFLTACIACLLVGPNVYRMARMAVRLQIILAGASVSLGVTAVWLIITFIFGRVYCASVCPVGILSDCFFAIRRKIPQLNKPFTYRHPSRFAWQILLVYVICLIVGVSVVTFALGPFNIVRNMVAIANPDAVKSTWATLSLGSVTGVILGIISFIGIAFSSLRNGREFCSRICPVGTALGYVQSQARVHIEIDPDRCTSCGLCEEICRTQSIKVVSRYVDQCRCVRCFDCVAECPENAIRYQLNRNLPATPMFRKARTK